MGGIHSIANGAGSGPNQLHTKTLKDQPISYPPRPAHTPPSDGGIAGCVSGYTPEAPEYQSSSLSLNTTWITAQAVCRETYGTHLTYYDALSVSSQTNTLGAVQRDLEREWRYSTLILLTLFAIEVAVYGFQSTGTIATLNSPALNALATASLTTTSGLLHLILLNIRYAGIDVRLFETRARGLYDAYVFFAINSRLPMLAVLVSLPAMAVFMATLIHEEWRYTVFVFFAVVSGVVTLEYIVLCIVHSLKMIFRIWTLTYRTSTAARVRLRDWGVTRGVRGLSIGLVNAHHNPVGHNATLVLFVIRFHIFGYDMSEPMKNGVRVMPIPIAIAFFAFWSITCLQWVIENLDGQYEWRVLLQRRRTLLIPVLFFLSDVGMMAVYLLTAIGSTESGFPQYVHEMEGGLILHASVVALAQVWGRVVDRARRREAAQRAVVSGEA